MEECTHSNICTAPRKDYKIDSTFSAYGPVSYQECDRRVKPAGEVSSHKTVIFSVLQRGTFQKRAGEVWREKAWEGAVFIQLGDFFHFWVFEGSYRYPDGKEREQVTNESSIFMTSCFYLSSLGTEMGKNSHQKFLLGIKCMRLAGLSYGFNFLGNYVGWLWREHKALRQEQKP